MDRPIQATAGPTRSGPEIGRWVYAIGRLVPRFPDLGVEKEFAQAAGGIAANELIGTDQLRAVLVRAENAYLAPLMCWVFATSEVETFMLRCADAENATRLVQALPSQEDTDRTVQAIVGVARPADPSDPCVATGLPLVSVDHMLTFTVDEFIEALVAEVDEELKDDARRAANDVFVRLTRRSGNWGLTDEDRARNYAALRYAQLYHLVFAAQRDNKSFLGFEVRASASPGTRQLVAIRVVFRERRTDVVERYQCLIDVTDRFPFLATSLTAVYD
ncbi:cyanobactin maturation protease PatG family protein [Amycolatopsis kentuckyensis]|uniref:cyanobactin maturation protease PatG family protein n=1 Tax=Amycolatopsis kentuckyensis TaxID=218823 RepID=UPI00356431AA